MEIEKNLSGFQIELQNRHSGLSCPEIKSEKVKKMRKSTFDNILGE